MSLGHSPRIITDNLTMYLDAANPKSYPGTGSSWVDLMGGSTATLINSPTHNSVGGYFSLDGTNQRVNLSGPSFTTDGYEYTLEVWFRMKTLPTAQYGINGHIWGGQNGNNLVMYVNPQSGGKSTLNMVYDDARYTASHYTNYTISANEWVQWVVVGDGGPDTMNFYINGELDRANTSVLSSQINRSWVANHFIGYDSRWMKYSELDIAICRLYTNKLLTPSEVQRNYYATKGRFGL